jgi:hypothetical protein
VDLRDGYVVVREVAPQEWAVSWYPFDEQHPDYPGHTLASSHADMPRNAGFEELVRWACERYGASRAEALAA